MPPQSNLKGIIQRVARFQASGIPKVGCGIIAL